MPPLRPSTTTTSSVSARLGASSCPEAAPALKIVDCARPRGRPGQDTDYMLISADGTDGARPPLESRPAARLLDNRKGRHHHDGPGRHRAGERSACSRTRPSFAPNAPPTVDPGSGTVPLPTTRTPSVVSKFGKVKITKVSPRDTAAKLQGAGVEVYQARLSPPRPRTSSPSTPPSTRS